MDFEPQKFFIGLMDFFSILLPGALLTFFLRLEAKHWEGTVILPMKPDLSGAKGWVAFAVSSYLLGHFTFLLGSWLDRGYDWLRKRTLNNQVTQVLRRRRPLFWWLRFLVWLVFRNENDLAVAHAGKLKRHYLASQQANNDTINNFQWAKALLASKEPNSLATVQRFEADSKFFRCFVIVLPVLLGLSFHWRSPWLIKGGIVLLIPLALWRYMEQRYKSTNQAYWFVMTLAQKENVTLEKQAVAPSRVRHAGGVVFWKPWWRRERRYLLVESSDWPVKWVLPKGKIEEGEKMKATAVREVYEETGVWARICDDLGTMTYVHDDKSVTVQLYRMQRVAGGVRRERDRKRRWMTVREICDPKEKRIHEETKQIFSALS